MGLGCVPPCSAELSSTTKLKPLLLPRYGYFYSGIIPPTRAKISLRRAYVCHELITKSPRVWYVNAPRGRLGNKTILKASADANTDAPRSGSSPNNSPPSGSASGSSPSEEPADRPERQPRPPTPPRRSPGQSWLSDITSKITAGKPIRFVVNVAALFLLMRFWPIPGTQTPLSRPDGVTVRMGYSQFARSVKRNEISRLAIDGNTLTFQMRPTADFLRNLPTELEPERITFQTVRPPDLPTPYDTLMVNGVEFSAVDKRSGGLVGNFLGYTFALVLLIAVLNRMGPLKLPQRGAAARRHTSTNDPTRVTFDDVAGVDEAKEELQEIVEYLKDPQRFARLGARPPSGVLLIGPPGTGKTLLAKAVAGEAGVPFFSIAASEFVELYVGMGALRVRELFAQARKDAPAIVFIDEIDAVAKGRDSRLRSVGNDEREQTLNQLLTELDGFDSHPDQTVICIAATNRPDVLDTALLRPGRFDRRVAVERPDRIGRQQILDVHIHRKALPLSSDVDIPALASQTAGFTGADLANVVNEAALLAGRAAKTEVSAIEFDAAILRAVAGIEKKRNVLQGLEKQVVARHEAGHAVLSTAVAALVPGTNPVERLSIIPRTGGALGFTYSPSTAEDRVLLFENEIRGQLSILMGGRAAEAVTGDAVSSGAADDLRRATDLAHRAVAEYGMSSSVGPLNVAALAAGGESYSLVMDGGGEVGRMVEREVRALCETALAAARDTIELNRDLHASLSSALEREERLDGPAVREALGGTQVPASLRAFVLRGHEEGTTSSADVLSAST